MTGQADRDSNQAGGVPTITNNKSYMNSVESKNHGYPPWVGGIGIVIPSLYIPPYWVGSKFFSSMYAPEIFHVENSTEILITENFTRSTVGEIFSLTEK